MRKSTPRRETPVAFILAILQAYENRGIDPVVALSQAGFRREDLHEPSDRVAVEPFEALSTYAMRELDDEGLGWFSRRLRWGTYGMLLRASLASPSLDIALRRWCRHHNLLTEDIRLEMRIHGSQAVVRIHEMVDLGDLREFCLVSLLRNLHGVACWLADSRIVLDKARFPFSRPSYADAYRRMFQGAIVFQAAEASITFDAAYLLLPVVREDNALRQILQNPIRLMARLYRQDRLLSRRIIELLSANSGGLDPDAEAIAENLGVSVRSLQRHLREEGTSLQVLKSRVRLSKAADLLRRGNLPIKRIAYLTGYRDESSFSRAFRRWTGQSPAEFRCSALPLHQSLAFDATHSEHRD